MSGGLVKFRDAVALAVEAFAALRGEEADEGLALLRDALASASQMFRSGLLSDALPSLTAALGQAEVRNSAWLLPDDDDLTAALFHSLQALPPDLPPIPKAAKAPLPCLCCQKVFRHRRHLILHRKTHIPAGSRFACTRCGLFLKSRNAYSRHLHRRHGCPLPLISSVQARSKTEAKSVPSSTDSNMSCPDCNFQTRFRQSLHRHRKRLHLEASAAKLACPDCSELLATASGLREHRLYRHTDAAPHIPCRSCPAAFRFPRDLAKHRRFAHSAQRTFPCPARCLMTFKTRAHAARHLAAAHPVWGAS